MKNLWVAGICLGAAVVAVLIFAGRSPIDRVYNLDLENPGISDTYLILHRREADRCFVVDRRDATRRRSDDRQPGRKWQCHRMAKPGGQLPTWLLQSKRKRKGTVFLLPVSDVPDWSYPFLYDFVRKHREALELPKVEWTQLFVSRLYQGLYLSVALPFDLRAKDGGSGVLRELLLVDGERVSVVNTRFEDVRGVYAQSLAAGEPPTLGPQPAPLVWLGLHSQKSDVTFVMSTGAPYDLRLLPLPVSLVPLFELRYGRKPISFEDERHLAWQRAWRSGADPLAPPFDAAELSQMRSEFESYSRSLRRALAVDAQRRDIGDARLAARLASRQSATAGLGPLLGTL
jgi:hypothetical protein